MMHKSFATTFVVVLLCLVAAAQGQRTDVIWARSTAGAAITIDGNLN